MSEGTSRPRITNASISTASAVPRPSSLMKISFEVTNAPIATANRSAAAVTIRPVRSRPIATASVVGDAAVVRFLDPREQEDAVVGGEPEGDREEQDRLGRVERAGAPVGEQALQAPVLEDQDEDAEHGAEAERVHQHRLHSEHERAGHQEEDEQRRGDDEREHEGEVRAEAVLEVDESGGIARDAEVERRSQRAHVMDELSAGCAVGRRRRRDVDEREVAARPAGRARPPRRPGGRGCVRRGRSAARDPAGAPTTTSSGAVRPGGNSRAKRRVDAMGARARGQFAGVDGQELDRRERHARARSAPSR